jgi:hypothetical protein
MQHLNCGNFYLSSWIGGKSSQNCMLLTIANYGQFDKDRLLNSTRSVQLNKRLSRRRPVSLSLCTTGDRSRNFHKSWLIFPFQLDLKSKKVVWLELRNGSEEGPLAFGPACHLCEWPEQGTGSDHVVARSHVQVSPQSIQRLPKGAFNINFALLVSWNLLLLGL